eukprot:SAG31_NODE_48_length_30945_cov_16.254263_33_plen_213_part_00
MWYRTQGALNFITDPDNIAIAEGADEIETIEATHALREAEFALQAATNRKGAAKALRSALVDARARLLTLEIYGINSPEHVRLPTSVEVKAHVAAVQEEEIVLTQTTAVLGELASSHEAAVAHAEAMIGSLAMLRTLADKPKVSSWLQALNAIRFLARCQIYALLLIGSRRWKWLPRLIVKHTGNGMRIPAFQPLHARCWISPARSEEQAYN